MCIEVYRLNNGYTHRHICIQKIERDIETKGEIDRERQRERERERKKKH